MIIAGVIGFILGIVTMLVIRNNKKDIKQTVSNTVDKI